MKRPIYSRLWRPIKLGLLFGPIGAATAIAQTTAAEEEPEFDTPTLLQAMGYFMAQQINLDIGFSEEELNYLLSGMRNQANGMSRPDNYDDLMREARNFYVERHTAHREAISAENRELGEIYLSSVKAKNGVKETL